MVWLSFETSFHKHAVGKDRVSSSSDASIIRDIFRATASHMPTKWVFFDPTHPGLASSLLNYAFQCQEDVVIAKDRLAPSAWGVCCFVAEQQSLVIAKGEGTSTAAVEKAILSDVQCKVQFASGSEYGFKQGSRKCEDLLLVYKRVKEAGINIWISVQNILNVSKDSMSNVR